MTHGASIAVFIAQLVVLLSCGRLLGELMQRLGQPPVIGQILAGVLLGPSVLGRLAPLLWQALFPASAQQHAMLDALAQLGIVLLLLITGMETDLSVFRTARRPAIAISLSGIVVPFLCGCLLGTLLPDSMVPKPSLRLVTTLFLGTALSISSVKILALVIRELGFVRRTVGQVIIAASILDDTVGWILMSVIFGLALHGVIDLGALVHSVVGITLFLILSLTYGRRLVARILRWSNDSLSSEMASITTILVLTGLLALLTNALGVHFVLGGFIAGVLLGQSPLLTRQLNAQLRGLIVALFMPVFFATVGLSMDLSSLAQPRFIGLTLGLIALASAGKFLGAFVGGRLGGLSAAESFAVGCGMNARGSTEVIVASIGLQLGALNLQLFTAIVAMAVVTTMAMPLLLRWAFSRLPLGEEERARLEREEFETRAFLPQIEQLLVAVDASPSGRFASHLAGLLAAARRTPTTVLHLNARPAEAATEEAELAERSGQLVQAAATAGRQATASEAGGGAGPPRSELVDVRTRSDLGSHAHAAIASEAQKGYGLLLIGCEPAANGSTFTPQISETACGFPHTFAIAIARAQDRKPPGAPLNVLVTVDGTRLSRHSAEIAIALAHASRGSVTALHVVGTRVRRSGWRLRFDDAPLRRGHAAAVIREVIDMGEHYGIEVRGEIRAAGTVRNAVLRQLARTRNDLLVMGAHPRPGDRLFLGELAAEMLERAGSSLLFVCSEPLPGAQVVA